MPCRLGGTCIALSNLGRGACDAPPGFMKTTAKFDWPAVLKSGCLAGAIWYLIPLGSPWTKLSWNSGAIMGRETNGPALVIVWVHLFVALAYTMGIAAAVRRLHALPAMLAGALSGFVLYLANYALVHFTAQDFIGNELGVAGGHALFGALVALLYKGFSARKDARDVTA
jgi:hypothetical protein